jgi:hypothetical protein
LPRWRSRVQIPSFALIKYNAEVVELVDTLDLKSNGL